MKIKNQLTELIYNFLLNNRDDTETIRSIFGSLQIFFKFIDNKKLFHIVSQRITSEHSNFKDFFIYVLSKNDDKLLNEILFKCYPELKLIDNEYYVVLGDYDFEVLYCDNSKIVISIFFSEYSPYDIYDHYYELDLNSLIEGLNNPNKDKLKQIIINKFKDIEVSEIFEELDEPFYITGDNINEIFKDKFALINLFDLKEMADIKSSLSESHNNAESNEMFDRLVNNIVISAERYGIYLSFDKIEKDTLYAKFDIENFINTLKNKLHLNRIRLDFEHLISDIVAMENCARFNIPESISSYSKFTELYNDFVSYELQ